MNKTARFYDPLISYLPKNYAYKLLNKRNTVKISIHVFSILSISIEQT